MTNEELAMNLLDNLSKIIEFDPPERFFKIGSAEAKVMHYVVRTNGSVTPTEIAEYLNVTPARVAAIFKSLEKKNLIRRDIDKSDRRKIAVSLTEHGKEFSCEIQRSIKQETLEIIEAVGEEDTYNMLRITDKVLEYKKEKAKLAGRYKI